MLLSEVRMSSKRRVRRRSCDGKQAHATRVAAEAHRQHLLRSGDRSLACYHCKFGDHWHVGHLDGRGKISAAAKARNRRKAA